ncbi:transmembrane 4 L6 family member 18 isoform X1 [Equus quagga]|uniref:Transmembrane 4 L six family member 18 n=2 Tax=Equus TaxID=9789 RepID=F7A0Q9_HORSE|nr:transmembrane 4 L6 family member 18 isoform X3 [Equus caballus]XP_008524774.1 PREDICTED: transmembrane 4 L6 family member 18 isoform X3 [Equus przewalskii]XP_023476855.1 transmembrane 4 L6 family member 18 isoform X3 [Equus caballus]XP_046540903.1 transmembrane 4 L6 family member 18 isoform X1 [Equus quagga]
MGSRKCGGCLSGLLIPLALWSITVNILLYFPNGQTSYASSNKLTNYVWYFEGICFSGVMMLIVAAVLLVLENNNNCKCCQSENCSKKYMTLLSIIFSALGIACSGYCLVISALGLVQGPYCRTLHGWEYAFEGTAGRFLTDSSLWIQCLEPAHVVEWNIILFSILIALSGLQVIVCLIRVVIQLSKILCGTYSVIIQVRGEPGQAGLTGIVSSWGKTSLLRHGCVIFASEKRKHGH